VRRYLERGGNPKLPDAQAIFDLTDDPIASQVIERTRQLFVRFAAALVSKFKRLNQAGLEVHEDCFFGVWWNERTPVPD